MIRRGSVEYLSLVLVQQKRYSTAVSYDLSEEVRNAVRTTCGACADGPGCGCTSRLRSLPQWVTFRRIWSL